MEKDDLKIFICTHKIIENAIPFDPRFVIAAQNKDIPGIVGHDIIYMDDEFTQKHNICYGEGCQIRWLWKHQEYIPKYIGIVHYRRFFVNLINENTLNQIPKLIDIHKAILPHRLIHLEHEYGPLNINVAFNQHVPYEFILLNNAVNKCNNIKFIEAFNKFLMSPYQLPFNIFIMSRENFIEMCDIVFPILEEYDKLAGFTCNDDVKNKINWYADNKKWKPYKIEWNYRLQGFWLEFLTDTFYRYKFSQGSVLSSPVKIIKNKG